MDGPQRGGRNSGVCAGERVFSFGTEYERVWIWLVGYAVAGAGDGHAERAATLGDAVGYVDAAY